MRSLFKIVWIGAGFFMLGCLVDFPSLNSDSSASDGGTDSDSSGKDTETVDTSSNDSDSSREDSDSDTDTALDAGDSDSQTDTDTDTDTDTGTTDTGVDSETDTDTHDGSDSDTGIDTETDSLSSNQDRALYVSSPPSVDGDLGDSVWNLSTAAERIVEGETENSVLFDVLWDENNLYIAVQVTDSEICTGVEHDSWFFDSVEIYVDPNMSKDNVYDDLDTQMVFKWVDENWIQCGTETDNCSRISFHMKGAETSTGYTVEVRIAWSSFSMTPSENMWIGFDIGVNDDDAECSSSGQSRDGSIRWQGTMDDYQNTSLFGELLLSGIHAE